MTIIQQPDALSLSYNIRDFRISSTAPVSFVLKKGDVSIVAQTYEPGQDGYVTIKVRDIIHAQLAFVLQTVGTMYEQPDIVADFTAVIDTTEVTFRAIRSGVENFADTAANFLTANWLTWQPQEKPVTYASPEFLTYYAVTAGTCKLKAYYTNETGNVTAEETITVGALTAEKAYTIPMQYAVVSTLLGGKLPAFYDVWIEDGSGNRLTYIQRYYAGNMKSEQEDWILFENSLGGIDTFRAYGATNFTGEHTHNIAEIDEVSEEYRVDTQRKYQKNTGYLNMRERRWLLDFFPSARKLIYTAGALRSIVVTDSDVTYQDKELPSSYTFTYKYADAKPLLNIARASAPAEVLNIAIPDLGNFTVPPRLVELASLPLTEGALFPVQSPYDEAWKKTTAGALFQFIANKLTNNYNGGGGIGHTHDNLDLLQLLSYVDEYLEVDSRKIKAGYADDFPDEIEKVKTFLKGIESIGLAVLKDGAQFGTFVKSLYAGTGAGIDAAGNAEFESVRVRSYFEAVEFIINRLSAIEGDQLLTEADTIESVDDLGNNCYGLHLRSKWDGYFTAQVASNVLKGIINTLDIGSGTYYTGWYRVNSVNAANNYIEVTMYPDDETPAGKNFPPSAMMKVARWGNQTDTTRQSCLYLSSTEGRIVKLTGVTKPIIDKANYGVVLGTPPEFLKALNLPLRDGRDYMYAAGIITTDIIRTDYQGRPIADYVDRGSWNAAETYYSNEINPTTGIYEISDVWYNGCKYRCQKTGTTTAPAWNNTDWAIIEGNPEFTVYFAEIENIYDPDNFNAALSIVAKLYNLDITQDILAADVAWTRYSEDTTGMPRTASDNAWAIRRANSGKVLTLTLADCDINGYMPKKIRFTATVTLRDGTGKAASTQSVSYEY